MRLELRPRLGLLGLVAGSGSNWFDWWGRMLARFAARPSDEQWLGGGCGERFCLGMQQGSNPIHANTTEKKTYTASLLDSGFWFLGGVVAMDRFEERAKKWPSKFHIVGV